jgi:hypothetical protein
MILRSRDGRGEPEAVRPNEGERSGGVTPPRTDRCHTKLLALQRSIAYKARNLTP